MPLNYGTEIDRWLLEQNAALEQVRKGEQRAAFAERQIERLLEAAGVPPPEPEKPQLYLIYSSE